MTGLKSETFKYDETVRYIVHLDMDAFFAAVEQRDNPQLMGKPVIIGADPRQGKGRGVVSTCSYEARKFGVHSAMPISRAYKLCPQGIYLSGSHKKYSLISKQIFTIMYDFSPDIEPVSIDEAFIDITRTWHLFNSPENVCIQLKKRIYKELGLKCSTGLASNKLVAKIASDFDKPDGMVIVPHDKTAQFLEPLDVKRMWGIGKVCLKTLHSMNIYTLGQLAGASSGMIKSMFGDNGLKLQARARGIDNRPVAVNDEIKSVSNEYTFDEDTGDIDTIMGVIMHLSEKVAWRLQAKNLKGQKVSVKIRTSDFCTYTRDKSIDRQIDYDLDIKTIARNLFITFKKK
jgi:nucleotidyltransferase/DNA polymerase involved in DNA repair